MQITNVANTPSDYRNWQRRETTEMHKILSHHRRSSNSKVKLPCILRKLRIYVGAIKPIFPIEPEKLRGKEFREAI